MSPCSKLPGLTCEQCWRGPALRLKEKVQVRRFMCPSFEIPSLEGLLFHQAKGQAQCGHSPFFVRAEVRYLAYPCLGTLLGSCLAFDKFRLLPGKGKGTQGTSLCLKRSKAQRM